jgi:hypothetical protein
MKKYGGAHWSSPLLAQHLGICYGNSGKNVATTESRGQELPGLLAATTHRRRGQPPLPRQPQKKLGNNHLNSGVARRAARARYHLPSRETTQPTPTGTAPEKQPRIVPTNSTSQPPPTSSFTLWVGDESAGLRDVPTARQRRAHAAGTPKDAHRATVGIILSSA